MSRVLFVDEPHVLDILRGAFRSQAMLWDMEFASDPDTAVHVMAATPIDVIVAGTAVLAAVRPHFPDTARVMLEDPHVPHDLARTINLAHQFVSRPIDTDDLLDAIRKALRLREQVGPNEVRRDISDIAMLPTPSPVFVRLLEAIDSPTSDARKIATIVSHDTGLTAKVLQLVNSSFFAPRTRITSVEGAVVRLGSSVIRTLAFLDEVNRGIHDPIPVQNWVADLASHTYEVADLARQLAGPALADDAFCGGLLHECGQLVFARCRPDLFNAHLAEREEQNCGLAELERRAFGVTHAQAGAYLLNLWGCPIDVIDAVAFHDATELARNERVQVVQVAHRLIEQRAGISLCGAPRLDAVDFEWIDDSDYTDEARAWLANNPLAQPAAVAAAGA